MVVSSSRALALLMFGALAACSERPVTTEERPLLSPASSSAQAGATSAEVASSRTSATPLSSLSAPPADPPASLSWVGVPIDGSIALPKSMGFAGAAVRLSSNWKTLRIANGMAETDDGVLAYLKAPSSSSKEPHWGPVEKDALIVLTTHAAIDDSLLDYGAGARLRLIGDAGAEHWDTPVAAELGPKRVPVFVLRAKGTFGARPAELWQLRRKFPSSKKGLGWSLLVLGAIRTSASTEVRAQFLASLASTTTDP